MCPSFSSIRLYSLTSPRPAPLSCFSNSREEGQFWWGMMTRHLDTPWNNSTDFHERGDMTLYIDRYEALAEYPRRCHSMQQSVHPDILRYMGTAASVRDLIALADYFQGPGTPVNFWGISSGALIGSYMINSEDYSLLRVNCVV